jgi:predicted Rdx family selenoprotein
MSIDTRFADQVYGTTADFMIRMPATMRNVGRVALTSTEIPQVTYVFSSAAGIANVNFTVVDICGGVTTALDISEGNYTAPELAAAITAAMEIDVSGACVYDPIGNRFSFVNTGGGAYSVALQSEDAVVADRPKNWGLGYNLGFRGHLVTVFSSPVTATASPSLGPPAYLLLQLQCPDMMENTLHRLADGSFVQALAKVVLRPGIGGGFYEVQYDDARNGLRKENVFVRPTAMTQLRIRLLDAYGVVVDMGDTDWSMTLEFTEVVSLGVANALNRAMPSYAR